MGAAVMREIDAGAALNKQQAVHPGSVIRQQIVKAHGLSVGQAAEALGVARPTLSLLLNEHASLTPEMALRIEKAFGASMETLLLMQCAYDMAQVRSRADEIAVDRYVPKERPTEKQASLL